MPHRSRLDKPIISGIETVNQKQNHRPDQEKSKGEQQQSHEEMALGQTARPALFGVIAS
jgi:hypothetical protein